MTSATRADTRSGGGLEVVLLGGAAGLALFVAFAVAGPVVAAIPLVVVAGWWLLSHPLANLGLFFATTVLFEASSEGWPVATGGWYEAIGGLLHVQNVLLVLLIVAVVRDRRDGVAEGVGLGAFALPLALLAVAIAGGVVTGYVAGGDPVVIYNSVRVLSYLVAVPWVTAVLLVRHHAVRRALHVAVGLVVVRAVIGIVVWFVHGRSQGAAAGLQGVAASINASAVTFYEPAMNFLMVIVLLGVVTALVARHHVPRWLLLAAPVVGLTLLLSFRRSFWVALLLGLVLVTLIASGRRGRPWMILGGAAVVIALYLTIFASGTTDLTNPVVSRAQSLEPSQLLGGTGDRYRLDEQRNVTAEVRAHASTGIGLGVPWKARYPLIDDSDAGRQYTHVTALWFWLKLGPLGALAYAWMMATAILESYRAWRRPGDRDLQITGLALAAAFVGLVVAELTGPFTGIDVRITVINACVFGWLIADRALRRAPSGQVLSAPVGRPETRSAR